MNLENLSCAQPRKWVLRVSSYAALVLSLFLSLSNSHAQPPTDISGVINSYHRVYDIVPSKACLLVTNASALSQNRKVMIVQMKGAGILTSNNASFGDTTSLNQAGDYEIGTICYIIGDSVFLFHELLNTYNHTTGKVQLVQFAEYYSARVVGTIKPALWDSAAGTGGIIALSVDESLELNAPIWADTSGYKGGAFTLHDGTCNFLNQATGYATNPLILNASTHGAYKGESVANLGAITNFGARGAPANGGGGGNNHNNSGGGGANLSAGGRGGGNSSSGAFGCTTAGVMGIGGRALSSWSGRKIFFGGGGGSGHNNYNGLTSGGGEGGGIIFIHARTIIGNGQTISANGGSGSPSLSDGAGGGGAGGTIIMDVETYTGSLNIEVRGGKGGDSDDSPVGSRCYGGGGGGSGGIIYFTGSIPSVPVNKTIAGGSGGTETGSFGTCNTPVAGLAGAAGFTSADYTYRRSFEPAGYCEILLPVKLISFTATVTNKKVSLSWKVENPEQAISFIIQRALIPGQWMDLKTVSPNALVKTYSAFDENPFPGRSFYRLKIIEKTNAEEYSLIRPVQLPFENGFSLCPNPASSRVTVSSAANSPVDLLITDLSGKIVMRKRIEAQLTQIDIAALSPGMYFVTMNGISKKLIIQ